MTAQSITINLPEKIYRRFHHRAQESQRTVEAELLSAVVAVYEDDELPAELSEPLNQLRVLDDDALWQAARSAMPPESAARLEDLHFKRQSEGLTSDEASESARLLETYERYMLVRAQAAVLLKERGHDVSDPAKFQPAA